MRTLARRAYDYSSAFLRWIVLSVIVGAACGLVGTLFSVSISCATRWREQLPWLIFLLPLGGLLIVLMYHWMKQPLTLGVDKLFLSIQEHSDVPAAMAPLIFLGTFITHLCGGSAGREGAALQLGGTLGNRIAKALRLQDNDRDTMTLIGMGALFSALFGTPLTAILFVMEVLALGHLSYSTFVPCLIASMTAYGVSALLNMKPESYALSAVPALSVRTVLMVGALAILCAMLSIAFCKVMHFSGKFMKERVKNDYMRAAVGGAVIILLTLLVGTRDYNGAGAAVIERAVSGSARPQDFLLKLLFTAITLSCGYKGGEIVPTFYVGATFGCVIGPLLGLDPAFAAAIAMVATFCGNTNCPIASIFLSIELFGTQALHLFVIACAISYMLSGNSSLYHAQLLPDRELKLVRMNIPRGDRRGEADAR
ncbi:MAG: chloride channel protein [Clostridia bacterium]|nr:chloride channel protein [Clostridia bacterium]